LLRQLPGGVYNYRLVIYALLLIIIMITRPQVCWVGGNLASRG
jgi:hypothetical protein